MSDLGIGSRAGRTYLCQMNYDARLVFLAEGLPIILDSARGFWAASRQLMAMSGTVRGAQNHAEEEAAKLIIVMDMVRCPKKLCAASRMGQMVKWCYRPSGSPDLCKRHFMETNAHRPSSRIRR